MVSEQLQSLGVSRLEITREDFNRIHERMISILTEMIERKSASGHKSNHYSSSAKLVSSLVRIHNSEGILLLPKIGFPYFNGEGPSEWLEKVGEYFQIHQVPDELRLGIAKMYLEGKAYVWFYGFNASHPNVDLRLFFVKLCKRFAETGEALVSSVDKIIFVGSSGGGSLRGNEIIHGNLGMEFEFRLALVLEVEVSSPIGLGVVGIDSESNVEEFKVSDGELSSKISSFDVDLDEFGNTKTRDEDEVEVEVEEIAPSSVGEYTLDGKYSFKTTGCGNYEIDNDALSDVQEKMQFVISSVSSWYKQASVQDFGNEEVTYLGKEVRVQNTHEGSLPTLSDHEKSFILNIRMGNDLLIIASSNQYIVLHYLLNPRMVKRMRWLLTSYKENILTFNLEDKVNLRGRDVMDWAISFIIGLVLGAGPSPCLLGLDI